MGIIVPTESREKEERGGKMDGWMDGWNGILVRRK